MSEPIKHHYIPEFYQRPWTNADGQLYEYSRPYKTVKAQLKYPSQTGFEPYLYTIPDAKPGQEQIIEKELMSAVDNWAAQAAQDLIKNDPEAGTFDSRKGRGWIQFIHSLIVRNPEQLALIQKKLDESDPEILEGIRDEYSTLRGPNDPPTFDEYKAKFALNPIKVAAPHVLPHIIGSKRVSKLIASYVWVTRSVHTAKHTMLTSDRPVIMTNGLDREDSHIVIPISPRIVFIATKTMAKSEELRTTSSNDLVYAVNDKVCEQAIDYVYGVDDSQLRFVANRLGKRVQSSPLG